MEHELIRPNAHIAIVHFPIALLVVGFVIELLTLRRPLGPARTAGRWMILIGALAGIPAATAGIYALADVHSDAPESAQAIEFLHDHAIVMLYASLAAAVPVLSWVASSNRWRRWLYVPAAALVGLSVVATLWAAWAAGEGRLELGDRRAAENVEPDSQPPRDLPAGSLPPAWFTAIERPVRTAMSPLQMHALVAGASAALSLGALAAAWRRTHREDLGLPEPVIVRNRTIEPRRFDESDGRTPTRLDPLGLARTMHPASGMTDYTRPVRLASLWVLAVIASLAAVLTGWWTLAIESDAWTTAVELVKPRASLLNKVDAMVRGMIETTTTFEPGQLRRPMHVVFSVVLVLSTIALTFLAAWPARKRLWVGLFGVLLLVAIAAQLWLGAWLMLDSTEGPLLLPPR